MHRTRLQFMKKRALILVAIAIPVLIGCASANTTSSTTSTATSSAATTTRTPEQDLALIDGNGSSAAGSEKIFASLLDETEPKCTEGRRGIADLTVKAVEVAKSKGVKTSNFDMLLGASKILAQYDYPQECLDIFAALALAASSSN